MSPPLRVIASAHFGRRLLWCDDDPFVIVSPDQDER
jgi:hypothetical protein